MGTGYLVPIFPLFFCQRKSFYNLTDCFCIFPVFIYDLCHLFRHFFCFLCLFKNLAGIYRLFLRGI